METGCETCYQPATKKCTGCGKVFCDLHVRYGAQTGGMYGRMGEVGYYCDECWETRVKKKEEYGSGPGRGGGPCAGCKHAGLFCHERVLARE